MKKSCAWILIILSAILSSAGTFIGCRLMPPKAIDSNLLGNLNITLTEKSSGERMLERFQIVNGNGELGKSFLIDKTTGRVWRYYENFNDKNNPTVPTEEGFEHLPVEGEP